MQTVFITGSSSGIGKETALYFHSQGWQVVATMRHPEKRRTDLHGLPNISLLHLDVEDGESIRAAVRTAVAEHQTIDVLVNNAGYSLTGLFESASAEQIHKQYQTNVFGLMAVTRELLPVFKRQKAGVVVNVASIGGRLAFPLYSLYNSTKWAVEGFSEALQFELKELNVKVKIIEPGIIKTDFYDRSMVIPEQTVLADYGPFPGRVLKKLQTAANGATHPRVIAKLIFRAATDGSWRIRYSAGKHARLLLLFRRILPDRVLRMILKSAMR